jgi:hypothetical protein
MQYIQPTRPENALHFEEKEVGESYLRLFLFKEFDEAGLVYNETDFRVESVYVPPPPARFEVGQKFLYTEAQPGRDPIRVPPMVKPMIVSYVYHDSDIWRYHIGVIVGREGEPIPARFQHCQVRTHDGWMYADYITMHESELSKRMEKPVEVVWTLEELKELKAAWAQTLSPTGLFEFKNSEQDLGVGFMNNFLEFLAVREFYPTWIKESGQ